MSHSITPVEVPKPQTVLSKLPLNPSVRQSVEVTGPASGSVAMLAGDGSLALVTGRAAGLLGIAACAADHTQAVDFSLSPLGLRIGDAYCAYYRGAVVGNTIIFVVIGCMIVFCLVVCHFIFKDPDWQASIARFHFPGILLAPYTIMLPGFQSSSTALVRHGSTGADVALGASALLVSFLPILWVTWITCKHFDCTFKTAASVEKENTENKITISTLEYHLLGLAGWKDNGDGFKYRWGVFFMDLCTRAFFLFVLYRVMCHPDETDRSVTQIKQY
jgi:hypothetical protein